jgi:acetate kinase
MGFTPLEGLMMATRSGTVDPGILNLSLRHKGWTQEELDKALNYESGLLGISGVSSDLPPSSIGTSAQSGRSTRR